MTLTKTRFDNVYEKKGKKKRIYTKSLYPEFKGFDEKIIREKGITYREANPERSKLIAGIIKGLSQIGMREGTKVLYLGASHGYTPSYVSDIVGEEGIVICVDIAPRVVRDLYLLCKKRKNMIPILANSRHPEEYEELIIEKVDAVFQDIAQRDQVKIFFKNTDKFLKKGGFGVLVIKARSIDVSKKPKEVFKQAIKEIQEKEGYVIVDKKSLEPLEKDHIILVIKKTK